jgi:DNA polymerase-1
MMRIAPWDAGPGDHLLLIDGSAIIHRNYHALPPLTTSDGRPTGALSGLANMLWYLQRDIERGMYGDPPTHIAFVMDGPGKTFRSDIFDGYKAQRPPKPDDLIAQIREARRVVDAFGIQWVEQAGFEADDLLATYAAMAAANFADATVITPDKDLMQMMRPGVRIWCPIKKRALTDADSIEKFGVPPHQVVEAQALIGDVVDNVPGVDGIGDKTAAQLIGEFKNLEGIYANLDKIKQSARRAKLALHQERAFLSRQLVRLNDRVPLTTPIEDLTRQAVDLDRLTPVFDDLEFASLSAEVSQLIERELAELGEF